MFGIAEPEEVIITLEGVDHKAVLSSDEPSFTNINGHSSMVSQSQQPKKNPSNLKKKYVGKTRLEKAKIYAWDLLTQLKDALLNPRLMGDIQNLVVNQFSVPRHLDCWAPYRFIPGDDEILAGKW